MSLLEHPVHLIIVLFALSLLPLFAVMGTSFLKISIVLSMLRTALGVQQIPPNMAIYGLSMVLTLFIMAPVGSEIYANLQKDPIKLSAPDILERLNKQAAEPYREFLKKHSHAKQITYFSKVGHKIWPKAYHDNIDKNSLMVLIPAFTLSQLIEAFKIGLLLYLPFVAIDIIVSNILLAMGMMMVSPMTIALPFKILIFIMMGGWEKLISQLMLSYS
ncbi:EscR/YscR/HrcR family type III secretion system export apparatus protein [Parashewanella curva]|uniref:EscR/YscR/HrcR family type III secretion system export apparatus protein n=1 Tax=Parashewanella curva TaxID=2338552 RepID=A0A3L8PZA8_9GAMM|nr:type III secretion system export apparatus subunit SctR [Parashewanella curva]RLV60806.1 EscR/YscR/HrcR family type III secretion system export apparatus protein [Parashewanella curva]